MSDVIFCATDFYLQGGYRSYTDLYRLVELAGYPIIPVSQIDPRSDNTYILTPANDETAQGWVKPKARIILWQMEWIIEAHRTPPGVSEVWCSDKWQADTNGFRYIPMGSDYRLVNNDYFKTAGITEAIYDVAQIAYQTGRRQIVTQQLRERGLRLAQNERLWGTDRSLVLNQSRAMLHVHQHDNAPGIAPLRWCLAAAHHLPMISERVNDTGIFGHTYMVTADYKHLAEFTAHMLKDPRLLADYAEALNDLLCHRLTFRKSIEAAL